MGEVIGSHDRLQKLEYEHDQGRIKAVGALRKIHDEGLYKLTHKTWEEYLKLRWDYSKTYGKHLLGFSKLRDQCKSEGVDFLPENESQVRPILSIASRNKKIDPVEAWRVAVDTAPKVQDVPQVTGKHVESAMSQFGVSRPMKKPDDIEAQQLKGRIGSLAESKVLKRLSGHQYYEKYGAPARYKSLLTFLSEIAEVDTDGAA